MRWEYNTDVEVLTLQVMIDDCAMQRKACGPPSGEFGSLGFQSASLCWQSARQFCYNSAKMRFE